MKYLIFLLSVFLIIHFGYVQAQNFETGQPIAKVVVDENGNVTVIPLNNQAASSQDNSLNSIIQMKNGSNDEELQNLFQRLNIKTQKNDDKLQSSDNSSTESEKNSMKQFNNQSKNSKYQPVKNSLENMNDPELKQFLKQLKSESVESTEMPSLNNIENKDDLELKKFFKRQKKQSIESSGKLLPNNMENKDDPELKQFLKQLKKLNLRSDLDDRSMDLEEQKPLKPSQNNKQQRDNPELQHYLKQINSTDQSYEMQDLNQQFTEFLNRQKEPLINAEQELFLLDGQIWQRAYGEKYYFLAPTISHSEMKQYRKRITSLDDRQNGIIKSRSEVIQVQVNQKSNSLLSEMGIKVPAFIKEQITVLLPLIDIERLEQNNVEVTLLNNYGRQSYENIPKDETKATIWYEGFEGSFPTTDYSVGDNDPNNGDDYWDDVSCDYNVGSWSLWCADIGASSPCSNYDNYMDAYVYKTSGVDVSGYNNVQFTYWRKYDIENNYDYLYRYFSSDGVNWTQSSSFTGYSFVWTQSSVNLIGFQTYYWRFNFYSDNIITAGGAYLDDLEITGDATLLPNLTLDPSNSTLSVSGTNVTINARVINNGGTAAGASELGYYLSTNTTITTSDHLIGTDYVASLAVGSYSNETITTDVSGLAPAGTYYVGLIIDHLFQVTELNESDNAWYWSSPQVTIVDLPNLTLQGMPASYNYTHPLLTINARVLNNGLGSASSSEMGYYLSTNTTITTSDHLIGTDYVTSLAPGATSDETMTVDVTTVTPSIPGGTYYVGIILDHLLQVTETNENDNAWYFTPSIVIPMDPNLTIDPANSSLTVNGTIVSVSTRVINNGAGSSGSSELGYYLSTNTNITTSDHLIGTDYVPGLGVGGYSNESINVDVTTVTPSIPCGTFYVGLIVDHLFQVQESDETDNGWYWSSPQVTISPNLTIDPTNSSLTVTGTVVSISTRVINNSSCTASSSELGYYLSTGTIITPADYLIGTDYVTSLAAGTYSSESITIDVTSVTPLIPCGTYYVGLFVDHLFQVTESNENDNAWYWSNPQVTISTNLTIDPTNSSLTVTGTVVSVSTRVINNSSCTAGSSELGYYLSDNTTITTTDYLFGTDNVVSLAAGSYSDESINTDVMSVAPPGTYYVGIIVDHLFQVSESDENDNAWYWSSPQVIIPQPLPNLTKQSDNLTISGTNVTIGVTIINNGGSASGACELGYYLTQDNVWDPTVDYLIGTDAVPSLASGATSSQNLSIDVLTITPAIPSGDYYVMYFIDHLLQVTESDETDNIWYWPSPMVTIPGQTVNVDIPDDLNGSTGQDIMVPINVLDDLTGLGVFSFQGAVNFDPNVLQARSPFVDNSGTLSSGWGPATGNSPTPGEITFGHFGTSELNGTGTIINLLFTVNPTASPGSICNITFNNFIFNSGSPVANTTPGIFTVENLFKISGMVNYAIPWIPLPNTVLDLTGGSTDQVITDATGLYEFNNLTGGLNYDVLASKTGDIGTFSIGMFDASLIARHVVGLITLTPDQITAGDADQNGSIQMYDAACVATHVVGLPSLPGSQVGNWYFKPTIYSYTPLSGDMLNQDFKGCLCGDVDGNWPATFLPKPASASFISDQQLFSGKEFRLPIFIEDQADMYSAYFELEYPAELLVLDDVILAEDCADFQLVTNKEIDGIVKAGLYGTEAIHRAGKIAEIIFQVKGEEGSSGTFELNHFQINNQVPQQAVANFEISTSTELEITSYAIFQNYPNPFNPSTTIKYRLAHTEAQSTLLQIYNIKGQLIRTLLNQDQEGGEYMVTWDGCDDSGKQVSSGVYIYQLKSGSFVQNRKLLKMK